MKFEIGDVVTTKKMHPCGNNSWTIVRTGVDIKIKCINCSRSIMMPRVEFNKKVKKVVEE